MPRVAEAEVEPDMCLQEGGERVDNCQIHEVIVRKRPHQHLCSFLQLFDLVSNSLICTGGRAACTASGVPCHGDLAKLLQRRKLCKSSKKIFKWRCGHRILADSALTCFLVGSHH